MKQLVTMLWISVLVALALCPRACAQDYGRHITFRLDPERRHERMDPERLRLDDQENQLLRAFDGLRRNSDDLRRRIETLTREQDQITATMSQVQHELNRIHEQRLQ